MGALAASIVSAQLQGTQNNVSLAFIRQNAKADQELVNVIAQSSPTGGRGQNVDLNI